MGRATSAGGSWPLFNILAQMIEIPDFPHDFPVILVSGAEPPERRSLPEAVVYIRNVLEPPAAFLTEQGAAQKIIERIFYPHHLQERRGKIQGVSSACVDDPVSCTAGPDGEGNPVSKIAALRSECEIVKIRRVRRMVCGKYNGQILPVPDR